MLFNLKSQSSIFVFFAVSIVLIIIIGMTMLKDEYNVSVEMKDTTLSNAINYIEVCLDEKLPSSLEYLFGNSGTYINYFDHNIKYENHTIVYLYYNGDLIDLNTSYLEGQISLMTEDVLFDCYNSFFESQEMNITIDNYKISLSDSAVDITFSLNINLSQIEQKKEGYLKQSLGVSLTNILNATNSIVQYDSANHYDYSLVKLSDIASSNNLQLNITNNGNDTLIYSLYSSNSTLKFNFATTYKTYSCSDLPVDNELIMKAYVDACVQ